MRRQRRALALCLTLATFAGAGQGCVYRIDLQQGNVVTQDMINRLEPGMEARKVRFIMGTPLVTDAFNPNRWDYVYTFQPGGGKRVQRRITLVLQDARLVRIEGDIEASASQTAEAGERPETVVTVPDESRGRGFWGWLRRGDKETEQGREPPSPKSTSGEANPAAKREELEIGASLGGEQGASTSPRGVDRIAP